jgi:hypothetical protein
MTTMARPAAFRAGNLPGEAAHGLASAAVTRPAADPNSVVLLGDFSEFQPNIDPSYLAWSKAGIVRAAYGDAHDDNAWRGGARRAWFHDHGIAYLGMYQYIVAGQDITAQAKVFCALIREMQPGEDLFADIEEGAGNLQGRWRTWAHIVHSELGWAPSNYSGEFFAAAHGLEPVDWIAAYGSTEPAPPHRLWQFSSTYRIPGAGVGDCSVYHGSIADLAATAWQPSAVRPPPVTVITAPPRKGNVVYQGEVLTGAPSSVPVVLGATNRCGLYADGTAPPAVPLAVRVAVWSASKGYSQIVTVTLDDSKPHYVMWEEPDVAAVVFSRTDRDATRCPGFFITG